MKIYPVLHSMGLSLIKAANPQSALNKARSYFGVFGAPYLLGTDNDYSWASSMGARILE